MKIIVDGDVLVNEAKTGVYSYIQQLMSALLTLDHKNDYTVAYFGAAKTDEELLLPRKSAAIRNITWLPRRLYNLSLRTPFGLPFDLVSKTDGDLYIFTKFVKWPLLRRRKSLVFIYDTAFIDYPEVIATGHFRRYLAWAIPRTLKRTNHVVVISQNTKNSLIHHYGVASEKLSVITPAVDHSLFKPSSAAEIKRVREAYGIDKPYILSLGTLEPRKNLVALLRALLAAPVEFRQTHSLVLAGGKGWLDHDINQLYDELSTRMKVIKTGFVPQNDLPALYSGAEVFVFPSLFEGFGMPPLEAMACGTPVIAANNSSLPEVVGDAGVLIDAHDVDALGTALMTLLADPKRRAELTTRGLARAKTFSWESSAEQLLEVIEGLNASS